MMKITQTKVIYLRYRTQNYKKFQCKETAES